MANSTCRSRTCLPQSSTLGCALGSGLSASGTLALEMPWASCSSDIHCGKSAVALVAESRQSSVSSRSVSRASAACVDGTRGFAFGLDAARSGRVDGSRALGRECSRRRLIDPLLGLVGMSRP